MSDEHISIPATGFLRLSQILAIFPVSRSSWWRGCKNGRFPKPEKLSERVTAWRAEDIAALVQSPNKFAELNRKDGGKS